MIFIAAKTTENINSVQTVISTNGNETAQELLLYKTKIID